MTDLHTNFPPLDPFTKALTNTPARRAPAPLKSFLMAVFYRPGMMLRDFASEVGSLILMGMTCKFQTSRGQVKALMGNRDEGLPEYFDPQ